MNMFLRWHANKQNQTPKIYILCRRWWGPLFDYCILKCRNAFLKGSLSALPMRFQYDANNNVWLGVSSGVYVNHKFHHKSHQKNNKNMRWHFLWRALEETVALGRLDDRCFVFVHRWYWIVDRRTYILIDILNLFISFGPVEAHSSREASIQESDGRVHVSAPICLFRDIVFTKTHSPFRQWNDLCWWNVTCQCDNGRCCEGELKLCHHGGPSLPYEDEMLL